MIDIALVEYSIDIFYEYFRLAYLQRRVTSK